MEPREELNQLLNEAIEMASKLIERHGAHFPFAMAITISGERVNIAADDRETRVATVLFESVVKEVLRGAKAGEFRGVAVARNIDYVSAQTRERTDAIQVTLDHVGDEPCTCYLPYRKLGAGSYQPGELFATDPVLRVFVR